MNRFLIGVTGASGQIYAKKIIERLRDQQNTLLEVLFTETAKRVYQTELNESLPSGIKIIDNSSYFDKNASGSNAADFMIIIPCTMNTIARIASGITGDLLARAAEVQIKERKKLIVVPRETPLSTIHLQNMLTLTMAGVVVAPASPALYNNPKDIDSMADMFVSRLISTVSKEYDLPENERYNPNY